MPENTTTPEDAPEEVPTFHCVGCSDEREGEPALVDSIILYNYRNGTQNTRVDHYCEDCVVECGHCRETRPSLRSEDAYLMRRGRRERIVVCERCRNDDYNACGHCGEVGYNGDMVYRDGPGEYYCRDSECDPGEEDLDDEDGTSNDPLQIQGYHCAGSNLVPIDSPWTKSHAIPVRTFYGEIMSSPRYFGVELEVEMGEGNHESSQETAHRILYAVQADNGITEGRHLNRRRLVAERDGSLSHGFELISAPMGLDDHRRLWTRVTEFRQGLRSHNTTTCGLHVHVSRKGLTHLQIAKMVCFLNHPNNRHLITTVARRYGTNYCKAKVAKLNLSASESYDRYEMLNLTNSKTVEFRIFKGSLHLPAILAAIEFANAVTEYCADTSGAGMDLSTESFVAFIQSPRMQSDTKALRQYLASRRFAPFLSPVTES